MGGWDDGDGFEDVPLGHHAAPPLKPNCSSGTPRGGSSGGAEAARLRKENAELRARLKAVHEALRAAQQLARNSDARAEAAEARATLAETSDAQVCFLLGYLNQLSSNTPIPT